MSNTRTTHALTSPPTPRRAAVLGLARGRLHRLSLFAVLVTVGWVIGLRGVRAAVDQPVYIYLYAHTEDHINHDLSEERYRRLLPVLEALATSHPEYHVSVSMQFPGADTEALLTRNAENGILDFILSYQANGLIEAGYHGAHEPTYVNNALVTLPANATWEEHVGAGLEYLSYAKHPTRGDVDESRSGGLLLNLQTFGEARAVSGTAGAGVAKFFDTAVEHSVTNLLAGAGTATVSSTGGPVMLGLPDHGPGGGADYEATAAELIALLSPRADTPAEVFWMNNALRVNDGDFVDGVHAIIAHEGVATLKAKLAGLDRSRVHVLNVAVAGKWIYAKESPTKYAYAHPTSPELPAALQNTREQIETNYRQAQEALEYLVTEYFPRNPGSRFVSNADLAQMAGAAAAGQTLALDEVVAAARELLATWSGRPPAFVETAQRFLSLADAFALFAVALADYRDRGTLPAETMLYRVIGPQDAGARAARTQTLRRDDVLIAAATLAEGIRDETWAATPGYLIPSDLAVGQYTVNAAEFLRMMAETLSGIAGSATRSPRLVAAEAMPVTADLYAGLEDAFFPGTIAWSLKPAALLPAE